MSRAPGLMLPILIVALIGNAFAAPEPAVLSPTHEPSPVAGHVAVLADPSRAWTIADVSARADLFETAADAAFSFGYTTHAYWYHLALANPPGSGVSEWVVELRRPVLDYLDIHITRSDGFTTTLLTGDRRQAPAGQLSHRDFAVPLRVAPGETVALDIRAQTAGAHGFKVQLWTRDGFEAHAFRENFFFGAFIGGVALIALYNALIGLGLRDPAHLYYVLMLANGCCLWLSLLGYLRAFGNAWFAAAPAVLSALPVALQLLWGVFGSLFAREFLQLRERAPRLHLLFTALAAAPALALVTYPLLGFTITDQISDALNVAFAPVALTTAAWLALKGFRAARLYLLAWTLTTIAVTVAILGHLAVVPVHGLVGGAALLGILIAIAVLSLALADRIHTERRERERLSRLKRFFSPEVANAILEGGESALLAPKRREVTVLFTDLRGFTAFSAESEPEEVIRVLREYREVIVALAAKHHGTLEHFSGDGVMVYFNAPVEIPGPEASAVHMAFDLQRELGQLCEAWRRRTHELGVGVGMASGFATVGAVGVRGRMDYSVVGSVTNLAARLCAQAQHGQILVSRKLLLKIEKLVAADHLGERELKGLPKPVTVYNLTALAAAV